MKILKDGRIVDIWIGQCDACKAVMEASRKELDCDSDNGVMYINSCMYCKESIVIFYKINTKDAKAILRKSDLKTIYKSVKKGDDVGIYAPGTK